MIEKPNQENDKYLAAQARVRELKSFYYSLVVYVLINILLIIINLVTNPHRLWFFWVTLIWGIVLIAQAFKIFVFKGPFLGKEWEERKIKEMMKQDKDSESSSSSIDKEHKDS